MADKKPRVAHVALEGGAVHVQPKPDIRLGASKFAPFRDFQTLHYAPFRDFQTTHSAPFREIHAIHAAKRKITSADNHPSLPYLDHCLLRKTASADGDVAAERGRRV